MTALKPCPFCGCELIEKKERWKSRITGCTEKQSVYVHPKKGCVLDYFRFHFYDHPEQLKAWNRRVNED